jgi:hypothetical protein
MNMELDVRLVRDGVPILEYSRIKHIGNLCNFTRRMHNWNLVNNSERLLMIF